MMRDTMAAERFFREFEGDPAYERERAMLRAQSNLAINLLRLRKAHGLTQAELARRAGMRQPRIAEIERGDHNPHLDTLAKLAWAVGRSTADLLSDPIGQPTPSRPVTRTVEVS